MRRLKAWCCRTFWGLADGQATIEYVLMLSTVVVILSAFIMAFHHDIVKWFFMFIGEMLNPNG